MSTEVKIPASLEQESAIKRLDNNTFEANLSPSFCIGAGMLHVYSHECIHTPDMCHE